MVPLSAIQVAFGRLAEKLSFGSECDRGRRRESGRAEVGCEGFPNSHLFLYKVKNLLHRDKSQPVRVVMRRTVNPRATSSAD
jgi:hypothetical protein